jgi:MoaA/NifB/PqqE/SkfB family radical SAM enzyme
VKALSRIQALAIVARALKNHFSSKPIVVSFEVTLSCVAGCRHCDTGGYKPDEQRLSPEEYRRYIAELQPAVVQLSGGEPLLREDLPDIIKVIKSNGCLPYVIVVTNGYLLNEQKYLELKEAGADRFSVSLDFPNEKHDDFRRLPGLYAHLEQLIPRLASRGCGDVAMNCAITTANLPYLREVAAKCEEWDVDVSYSAYSILRTGDPQYFISAQDDLETLGETIQDLIEMKRDGTGILNSISVLSNTYDFFKEGGIPDCNAGRRFLVVRPEGVLNACSMYRDRRYTSQKEMLDDFSAHNQCKDCYVAIRAYSDKSLWSLSKDAIEFIWHWSDVFNSSANLAYTDKHGRSSSDQLCRTTIQES